MYCKIEATTATTAKLITTQSTTTKLTTNAVPVIVSSKRTKAAQSHATGGKFLTCQWNDDLIMYSFFIIAFVISCLLSRFLKCIYIFNNIYHSELQNEKDELDFSEITLIVQISLKTNEQWSWLHRHTTDKEIGKGKVLQNINFKYNYINNNNNNNNIKM